MKNIYKVNKSLYLRYFSFICGIRKCLWNNFLQEIQFDVLQWTNDDIFKTTSKAAGNKSAKQ